MSALPPHAIATLTARLHTLYADGSKHAVYQNVPEFVREALGYRETIDEDWRSDTPRYHYFAERLGLAAGEKLADVGANTGYFALNFARAHPEWNVHAFEPNPNHHAFIREISEAFRLSNVRVRTECWNLATLAGIDRFDAILLLNILHHAGTDFDRELQDNIEAFDDFAARYLQRLHSLSRQLCFQIGSNRGGNKARPLFPYNDDQARLDWTCRLLANSGWRIRHIGYAGRDASGIIRYRDLPKELLSAVQSGTTRGAQFSSYFAHLNLSQFPGEFYRRPLFICDHA